MVDVEFIKKRHQVDQWSIRKIASRLGISRQSVRKALAAPAEPPRYRLSEPRPAPVMAPFLGLIESWLEEDRSAPPKQRHTAKRIFDRLVDEYGFPGHESTVRRAVARLRPRKVEAFAPLEAPYGKIAQADFGGAVVVIAGVRTEIALFCMRAKASKVPFVIAYPTEKIEAFLAGHVAAFEFFGGAFAEVWYDNPKTAVTKILAGSERVEHERLSALRAHYLFDSSFCNPGEAHEKGSVENLVGYARRNALVPASRSFASFGDLNAHLRSWCERERTRHNEGWEKERSFLRELPVHPFRPSSSRPVSVSKTALVTVDRIRYSVPAACVGLTLRAEVFVDAVELYDKDHLVARHARSYQRGASVLDLEHYLSIFEKKRRAAGACAALAQADPVFSRARDALCARPKGDRLFAEILLLGRTFGMQALAKALEEGLALGLITPEVVRQLCLNQSRPKAPDPTPVPEALATELALPDLARYDALALARL